MTVSSFRDDDDITSLTRDGEMSLSCCLSPPTHAMLGGQRIDAIIERAR